MMPEVPVQREVVADEREANSSTGMVSPTRKAEFEAPVFAWKAILLSLMKCMVSCLMHTVKWQWRVRYNTENRLLHNAGT